MIYNSFTVAMVTISHTMSQCFLRKNRIANLRVHSHTAGRISTEYCWNIIASSFILQLRFNLMHTNSKKYKFKVCNEKFNNEYFKTKKTIHQTKQPDESKFHITLILDINILLMLITIENKNTLRIIFSTRNYRFCSTQYRSVFDFTNLIANSNFLLLHSWITKMTLL